jgi:CPA2 family monovalent cation:H+ antiporter-2
VGEFSFILATLGIAYGLLPREGLSLIVAGALISITLNPLAFSFADRLTRRLRARPDLQLRYEEQRSGKVAALEHELAEAERRAQERAARHRTLDPGELAERFPLFARLTPEQREVVILHFRPQAAGPGERIIRKGDKADAAYFISSGEVEVDVGGRRIRLGPGDCFGEMALISGQPRSAHVTALDYCSLLKLTTGDFREILRRYPEIRVQIANLAAQRGQMNREQVDGDSGSKDASLPD